mgnify:CR=1 FL=1
MESFDDPFDFYRGSRGLVAKVLRSRPMNVRERVLASLISLTCIVASCSSPLSEDEVKRLAQERIDEYARAESLASSAFGKPSFSSEPGHKWIFDYTSDTSPRHLVRIHVDARDKVEVARMIDVQP